MVESMPKSFTRLVSTAEELSVELSKAKFSGDEWVAVDAERASGFKYQQRAYLVQLGFENGDIWLIDPLLFDEEGGEAALTNLRSAMPGNWILHSSTQDFPCLFDLNLRPTRIFDTELAAKLLGLPRVGLASLLEDLLGVSLAKEHSASDWSLRPLSESMLAYAAADVQHLHALRAELVGQLGEAGRESWAGEEFNHLLEFSPKPRDQTKWKKLSGLQKVRDPKVLRIAKALWHVREDFASQIDMSPGRVLPDRSIVAAALAQPTSKSILASISEFKGRYSRSKLDMWWDAIVSSDNQELEPPDRSSDFIPHHRSWERKHPEAHERYLRVRPKIAEIAAGLQIAPEVLVSPEAIRSLCFRPPADEPELNARLNFTKVRTWQRSQILRSLETEFFGTS